LNTLKLNNFPFFSIVIPAFNAEKTIIDCLDSVEKQTFRDFEVIIINDGSSDRTGDLIAEFSLSSSLKIMTLNQNNLGVSVARNGGMSIAKGLWIAFLDADDEWSSNKLLRQYEIITANPEIDFLGTTRNDEIHSKFYFKKFDYLNKISYKILFYKNFFVTPTVIFKKSILEEVGYFDPNKRYFEDCNYWIKICHQHNCFLLNESLVTTGKGKPHFGLSGLNSNIKETHKGEILNLKEALESNLIGIVEYYFLRFYTFLKYYRRCIITIYIRTINNAE
jgi:glycosyltransferase involved in cell wall biosynthesis